jgi:hypothetical protein
VTKKTIQFKLPAMTAEPDRSTRELDHAGEWVEDVVKNYAGKVGWHVRCSSAAK